MSKLIEVKSLAKGGMKCIFKLHPDEVLGLGGNFRGIYAFSSDACNIRAKLVEMGIENSTKYFEAPENLVVKHRAKRVSPLKLYVTCQRLESQDKFFFIYVVSRA